MKKIFLLLLLVFCCVWLAAYSMEEAIDTVLETGSFTEHNGYLYFLSDSIMSEEGLYDEDGAVQFVAQTAYVFLLVAKDWDSISSSSITSQIKNCDKIACPYSNGYQEFLLEIPASEAYDLIDEDDMEDYDSHFYDMKSYIRSYGDHRNLGFWLDEE